MSHLYALEVLISLRKPQDVKLPAAIANLFEEESVYMECEVSGDFGPFTRPFKVSARTKNEADMRVEDRVANWLERMNRRFDHWAFEEMGITYMGEVEDD